MTNEEAIKILEVHSWGVTDSKYAEAVDKAKKAMDFRKPKQPGIVAGASMFSQGICPSCGTIVHRTEAFCMNCGQELDWAVWLKE